MAYNTGVKYSGNSNRSFVKKAEATPVAGEKAAAAAIFQTGLWTQEGGKSLASVQVREDVTIPAGSYINLYQTDAERMNEKSPHFKITIRSGVLKKTQE